MMYSRVWEECLTCRLPPNVHVVRDVQHVWGIIFHRTGCKNIFRGRSDFDSATQSDDVLRDGGVMPQPGSVQRGALNLLRFMESWLAGKVNRAAR